jgi:transposase
LWQQGWKQNTIARALGVTEGSVSQWLKRGRQGGRDALRARPAPGGSPRLTDEQRQQLPSLLRRGAEAFGFVGDLWTTKRIAIVIKRTFGVHYHPAHISRLMRALGWTVQQPQEQPANATTRPLQGGGTRAGRRSKKTISEGRTLVRVDEAGFYLLPAVVRTYAPCGETPILRSPLSYDHLSVISAITAQGRLLVQMQEQAYTGETVVGFLKHLLRHIEGKSLVIWDGAPIHRSCRVKAFLSSGAAARLHLEQLPAYAPDLNPDEGIWRYLKRVELRNVCCASVAELRHELRLAIARLRHKLSVISGCIAHAGYHL